MKTDRTLLLLTSAMLISCSTQTGLSREINRPAFSLDSQHLFFEYCVDKHCNLVMYNRLNKKLTWLVPSDKNLRFVSPGLAPKATQVVAVSDGQDSAAPRIPQVVLIDWQQKTFQRLTNDASQKTSPNYSYDGQKVAYIQSHRERTWSNGSPRATAWDINTLELATGDISRKTHFCFYGLSKPFFFPGSNDLIASAGEPMCNYPVTGTPADNKGYLQYKERFAENKIVRFSDSKLKLEPWFRNGEHSSSPSVSGKGDVLFVSRTNLIDGIQKSRFNYDLFLRRGDEIRRLTNLKTFINSSVISPDGKYAAYVSDPERDHHFSFWILDIENNTSEKIQLSALERNDSGQVNTITLIEDVAYSTTSRTSFSATQTKP